MNNTRRGLPLTSSRLERIFPKLIPDQIRRVAAQGHIRSVQPGEVLIEQGDRAVPFFVVITGEVEIVRKKPKKSSKKERHSLKNQRIF